MKDVAESLVAVAEPLLDLALLAAYLVATGVLTGLGLVAERSGLHDIAAGQVVVGLWYVYMGLIALYVGVYMLGYREVWPRLRGDTGPPDDG